MSQESIGSRGASPEAIRKHYDVGNDFYKLWLDPTMTYSCAMWEAGEADDQLEAAQIRKIDYHIDSCRANNAARVLDIGCGWGAALRRLVENAGVRSAVGLTLSAQQDEWIRGMNLPGVEVRQESYLDHSPSEPYDAIVSVGAFEHFCRRGISRGEKVAIYRDFFRRCHRWLKPGGYVSLQTISFGNVNLEVSTKPRDFFEQVFPESDLPTVTEIYEACENLFEPISMRNDRADYERTCSVWASRLASKREEAVRLAGKDTFTFFHRYLKTSAAIFHFHYLYLLRIAFQRLDETNPY